MGAASKVTNSFWRTGDGAWICTEQVTLDHPRGRMQVAPGTVFRRGQFFMGVDLALWLDDQANKPPPVKAVVLSH
jgi:hypothetical protein